MRSNLQLSKLVAPALSTILLTMLSTTTFAQTSVSSMVWSGSTPSVLVGHSLEARAEAGVFNTDTPDVDGPRTLAPGAMGTGALARQSDESASGQESYTTSHASGSILSQLIAVHASGHGVFDASAQLTRSWIITNLSETPYYFDISFVVFGGSMEANNWLAGGAGYAEYSIDLLYDSSTVWSSYARIDSDGELVNQGNILEGASQSGSFFEWDATVANVGLGVVIPGATVNLTYNMVARAVGDYGIFDSSLWEGDWQDIELFCPSRQGSAENLFTVCGSSFVTIGDPGELTSTPLLTVVTRPFDGESTGTNPVPVPGTLALLALGLLAGAGVRRRQN